MALVHTAAALLGVATAAAAAANPFDLTVRDDGSYAVAVAGFPALALTSELTAVLINGEYASVANGGLALAGAPSTYNGEDEWGTFAGTTLSFKSTALAADVLYASFKLYDAEPALVFESFFPTAVPTGSNYSFRDSVASSFPSFVWPATPQQVGVMQYHSTFINNGVVGPNFFQWGAAGRQASAGVEGGPLVFFEPAGNHSVVLSSASAFMSASAAQTGDSLALRAGVLGSVTSIPASAGVSFVLYAGAGVNAAMATWGDALLRKYGKSRTGPRDDYTNTHLIYNTDHGAFYYYDTGNFSNYLDALTAIYTESVQLGIPYKGVLLDSWWYFKGIKDGVKNWTAMPSVFPGGNAGIRNLTATTGWKVVAHNRYWSADNSYAVENGGAWPFYVDAHTSPAGGAMAVPLTQAFWEWLLQQAVQEWGLTTYEQDWLYNLLNGVDLLNSDFNAARTWLLQMNGGAAAAGVSVQYCMAYPRHALQSVELSQVTQIRASDDHVPGDNNYHRQWRLGFSSLLAAGIALAPFKDNFYSNAAVQPGGSVAPKAETSPSLQNAVSVLSAGPVTPADGIGFAVPSEILRACTAGGRLLQPSRPACAINAAVAARVFPGAGPDGEVYATFSAVADWAWGHVLAAALNASFALTPDELAAAVGAGVALHRAAPGERPNLLSADAAAAPAAVLAYSVPTATLDRSALAVQPFDAAHPIALQACGEADFQLWHTAPVFSNGWAYLGELSKYVPVAAARTATVAEDAGAVVVTVAGEAGEAVPLTFFNTATGTATTVACTLDASGRATAVVPAGTCA